MRRLLPRTGRLADDWRTAASCLGLETNLFFPPNSAGAPSWVALDQAKRICRTCPVQQACLEWALSAEVTDGIWGGLTSTERRSPKLRRSVEKRIEAPGRPDGGRKAGC